MQSRGLTSSQLGLLHSTVHDILCKRLKWCIKIHLVKMITHISRKQYASEMLSALKRTRLNLTHCVFLMMKHFMCVEQSTGTTVVYGEVNEHSLKINVWCALIKHEVTGPFFFEKPTVTSNTFLGMMENKALCHVPVGIVRWCTTSLLLLCFAFLYREFPDHWIG